MGDLLKDRVAVVTGGAQGLGKADALALAQEGADVAICDLNLQGAEEVSAQIKALGRKSAAFELDISEYEQVQETFSLIKSDLGTIGILINNAAKMSTMAQMTKMTKEVWDSDLGINLSGAFHCVKAVWDDMNENKYGRIVNMSSIAGLMGGFGQTIYSAAKSGIIGFTKSLALEGARNNIRVNCVAPSIIVTPAFNAIPEDYRKRMAERIPMKRLGEANEVGELVVFLVSEKSSFITGQCIPISGGMDLFVF
jgi:3-oxoacyl-[acyl-carrier protein] reductase